MSKQPLFSIGEEEVILQSEFFPEYNSEYVVQDFKYDVFRDIPTGTFREGFGYYLGFISDGCKWWAESSLRKKHKPSSKSFDELMKDLNKIGVN